MMARGIVMIALFVLGVGTTFGQGSRDGDGGSPGLNWQRATDSPPRAPSPALERPGSGSSLSRSDRPSSTASSSNSVTSGFSGSLASLSRNAGQIWKEYDLSSYTVRMTNVRKPEQAIVDWILRETGYEAWHSEPMGVLTADHRLLRVNHTPEMQARVADIVNRFLDAESADYTYTLRVVTVDSPTWRTKSQAKIRSVPVQTPGVNAWVLAREDSAILLAELRRRSDYREHNSPYLAVYNGQTTQIPAMRSRTYVRDILLRPDLPAGYEPQQGQVDEGFLLHCSPLLSADRRIVDATIKCDIDQVEKMLPVYLEAPTPTSPRNQVKVEVPQTTHFRFHERFRWPTDQVLLIGLGMVALPMPVDGKPLMPGVPLPIGNAPARADLLVFVECRGKIPLSQANQGATNGDAKSSHGWY